MIKLIIFLIFIFLFIIWAIYELVEKDALEANPKKLVEKDALEANPKKWSEIKIIIKEIIDLQYNYEEIKINSNKTLNKLRLSHIRLEIEINEKHFDYDSFDFCNISSEMYKEFDNFYFTEDCFTQNNHNAQEVICEMLLNIENNKKTKRTKGIILYFINLLLSRYSSNIVVASILEYELNLTTDVKFIIERCKSNYGLASCICTGYEYYNKKMNIINEKKATLLEKLNNNIDLLPPASDFNYNHIRADEHIRIYAELTEDIRKAMEINNN